MCVRPAHHSYPLHIQTFAFTAFPSSHNRPVDSSIRLTNRSKLAYRKVMLYILRQQLEAGDRLPGQEQIREMLAIGSSPLNEALQKMRQDGVLEGRRKFGTVIRDLSRGSVSLFTVGIAQEEGLSGMNTLYFSFIREALLRAQCHPISFLIPKQKTSASASYDIQELVSFELAQCDAIVSNHPITQCPCPVFQFGAGPMTWGIEIDISGMIQDAFEELCSRGCQSVLILSTTEPDTEITTSPKVHFHALTSALGTHLGVSLAKQFFPSTENQAYDGVICTDDHVTLGLTASFSARGIFNLPIITRTNRQLPISFFSEVIPYEIDAEQFAKQSVDLMLNRLLEEQSNSKVIKIKYHHRPQARTGIRIL